VSKKTVEFIASGISISLVTRVYKVLEESFGKLGESKNSFAIMELSQFKDFLKESASITAAAPYENLDFLNQIDLNEFATYAYVNLPPEKRIEVYKASNYDLIQKDLVRFSSNILYSLGYSDLVNFFSPLIALILFRSAISRF
jgi:hypothetical protein